MTTFYGKDVPIGTKLYTSPQDDYILKEALAYLETLANFGGTIQQAQELACKGVQKLKEMNMKEESFYQQEETAKRVHDDVELPPLPEARIESRQTDSTMRTTVLHTYDESDMRYYAHAAVLADREKRSGRLLAALQALELARTALADIADLADHEADERYPIARIALARLGPLRYRALSAHEGKSERAACGCTAYQQELCGGGRFEYSGHPRCTAESQGEKQ